MNDKNLVTKANELVMACQDLSSAEQTLIAVLASMVQPHDEDFKPYCMKIVEFKELLGLSSDSQYEDLSKITKGLLKKVIELKGNKRVLQLNWLSSADYKFGEGMIELEFSPKLKPLMLGLKERFTTYRLGYFLKLTGKYSKRFYEIFKCYEYTQTVEIKVLELMDMFKLPKTYEYFDIKRKVLEPARKEISEKTDIIFDYEPIKTGKKVTDLRFTIKPNVKNKLIPSPQDPPKIQPVKVMTADEAFDSLTADITSVKNLFRKLYNAELVDKFVKKMLIEKGGYQGIRKYVEAYGDYIKCRNVKNIAGDFYCFVMDGYEKPVPHNNKDAITAPKQEVFKANLEDAKNYEKEIAQIAEKNSRGKAGFTEVGKIALQIARQKLKGKE